jgi:hypothetical protein
MEEDSMDMVGHSPVQEADWVFSGNHNNARDV